MKGVAALHLAEFKVCHVDDNSNNIICVNLSRWDHEKTAVCKYCLLTQCVSTWTLPIIGQLYYVSMANTEIECSEMMCRFILRRSVGGGGVN